MVGEQPKLSGRNQRDRPMGDEVRGRDESSEDEGRRSWIGSKF